MKKYNVEIKFRNESHKISTIFFDYEGKIQQIITRPEGGFGGPYYNIQGDDLEKVELTLEEVDERTKKLMKNLERARCLI